MGFDLTTMNPAIQPGETSLARWLRLARWNMERALLLTNREVQDMFRDWRIVSPIILLTVIFPTIANWGAGRMLAFVEQYGANIVGERLIPFLMMVVGFFPISFSLIIALETFVGEKERQSLEPLLTTPLTDLQIYIGKTLSSTLPPLVGSFLGIGVYLIGVYFNLAYRPPVVLLLLVFSLNLIHALVMVSAAVVVSSQATSVRAANLLASFVIVPVAFLIQAEAFIMFWAQYETLWLILFGMTVLAVVLIRMGITLFNREALLGNEIDELNLTVTAKRWWHATLARQSDGPRRSLGLWYRDEVLRVIVRLRWSILISSIVMISGYFVGQWLGHMFVIPPEVFEIEGWYDRFAAFLSSAGFSGVSGVLLILFQNVRAMFIASASAIFSLGIAALLILILPMVVVGFLVTQMVGAGLDPWIFVGALLPHGLLELPAIMLAGAAAVRLGASVLAPPDGKTLGQGWIEALADATRLWVTVILPMLFLAALVEVLITPQIVLRIAQGS